MSTNWQYTPIVGDFSANGILMKNAAGTVVPLNPSPGTLGPAAAGQPRPGVLKWAFILNCGDPSPVDEQKVLITVPTPFSFTQKDVDTRLNALVPIATALATAFSDLNAPPEFNLFDSLSLQDQTVTIAMNVTPGAPNESGEYIVVVDFSHSAIN